MDKDREQLCPLWLSALIGLGVVLALASAYPRENAQVRSISSQPPSELSIAYLEAWIRIKPDSPEYLNSLVSQYLKLGRWSSALAIGKELTRLSRNDTERQRALLFEVAAAEQMAYEFPPADPRRTANIALFNNLLQQTSNYQWDIPTMSSFADKAREAGAEMVMTNYYKKLAAADTAHAFQWNAKIGDAALAHQSYDKAASAYFAAYDAAPAMDSKRHYFVAALKVLESGNQVARACDEGEKRIGDLSHDPETLRYLLNLARQANRTDLITRYARALVKLSPLSRSGSNFAAFRYAVFAGAAHVRPIPLYVGGLNTRHDSGQFTKTGAYLVAANVDTGSSHQRSKNADEYELVFKAFVESSQLNDAEDLAQKALDAHLDPLVWTRRLAEVSQWNNHPKKALKYWLLFAQSSDNSEAWGNVLKLAPQFDDDQAYLAAWNRGDSSGDSKPKPGSLGGLNSLLAQYMKLSHWESALRIGEMLKGQGDTEARQRTLLLEIAASEQLAYEFPPEDSRRAEGVVRFTAMLERTFQYQWDVAVMTWFAEKAHAVGADEIMVRYYQKLATVDTDHTSKWQGRIGDAALGRKAYDDAALAYFSAQDAAPTLGDKRGYFFSALKALVAEGHVDRACTDGALRAGDLAQDPETLRYLLSLARQANRTDLMARYARALVKYSIQSQRDAYHDYVGFKRSSPVHVAPFPASPLYLDGLAGARYLSERGGAHFRRISATVGGDAADKSAEKISDFDLAFRAFVESKQLDEAEKLAKNALDRHLDSLVWTRRLAQVAQWNNHPATALKYWLQFAQQSGNDEAWDSVLKLAPQLDNDQAYLAAMKHMAERSPANLAFVDKVIGTYERLGQPKEAMAYLKSRASGRLRTPMLERYAAVAQRSGNDDVALQTYRSLQSTYRTNSTYAMHIASLEYRRGNLADAVAALRQVKDTATDRSEMAPYWRLYGELARLMQNDNEAGSAYKHLLATGQSTASDLNAMTYFYQGYPIDAGRTAEMEFRKNGSKEALQSALQFYTEAHAWSRVQALLDDLTPEQRAMFDRSGVLLGARASYYVQSQQPELALADLRNAMSLSDTDDETRVTYLWALIDFGTDSELRAAMHKWRGAAKISSAYWGAFAAAELRMNNPARAVTYLRQQRAQSGEDPLWLMSLADAEEASGHADEAWRIRRQAWRVLQQKAASGQLVAVAGSDRKSGVRGKRLSLSSGDRPDLRMARVTLSQTFANSDFSRNLLIDLLKQEGRSAESIAVANSMLANAAGLPSLSNAPKNLGSELSPAFSSTGKAEERQHVIDAAAKNVALAWAISGEHNNLARAWLAREYANRLLRPADAEVTLALAANDRETLDRVLDSRQRGVSAGDHIAALNQLGRSSEAETVAYRAAEGAPDNSDLHETMVETILRDRPAVGVDLMGSYSDPLRYIQSSVVGGLKLTSRLGLDFEAIQRNQRTTDSSELAWVPARDRVFNLTLHDKTVDRNLSLTIGHRDELKSFYTAKVEGQFNRVGPFVANFGLGVNQFTDLSPQMQVGAVKDVAQLGLQWNPESRWFAQGTAEINRFYSQDRAYMGRGLDFTADFGYRFHTTRPDWSIRLVTARGVYATTGNVIPSLGVLLPDGNVPVASQFIPQNFTQYGLMVGLGTDEKNVYWRAWRPFADAGYVHDSNQGWGPQVSLGIAGSVFGNDHLRIFYLHEAASPGGGQRLTQIGLSYRLFY